MKSIVILILSLLFSLYSLAQKAIDFTMTDLDGKSWNLNEELDKGKTVVLDFFFAECVPCQDFTPMIADLYSDYGLDTGNVLVLGISDRDDNLKLNSFENTYGVNYPSCGIEGGGDSITTMYMSWFPFSGWPKYAVVCPNRSIDWDIKKNNGLPEVRDAIDFCLSITTVDNVAKMDNIQWRLDGNNIEVLGCPPNKELKLSLISLKGETVQSFLKISNDNMSIFSISDLPSGLYILTISGDNLFISDKIYK